MDKTRLFAMATMVAVAASAVFADAITNNVGTATYHLQGVACDGEALYWCYSSKLIKTDLTGTNLLAEVEVPMHSGDLCVHNGKLYVATDEGLYVRESNLKQEVRVYDAATLALNRVYNLDADFGPRGFEVSCIEYANGRFWLGAGMPETMVDEKNYVLEYTPSFDLVAVHELATGNNKYGIQTICHHDGKLYLGCYAGTPNTGANTYVCDAGANGFVPTSIGGSEGLVSVTGVLYTAVSSQKNGRYTTIATSVNGADRLCYSVNGSSGDLVDTPEQLLALGFLPKSRYYGETDQTFNVSGTEECNLIANAVPQGGKVLTLGDGADHAYRGGIAVASGTLEVPSAAAIDAAAPDRPDTQWKAPPVVLSAGTLRFKSGGTMARDFVTYPFTGKEKAGEIIEVPADAVVTNYGRFTWTDGKGNFLKTGAGTFVLATPSGAGGAGSITNHIGGANTHDPQWINLITPFNANGDGPTLRVPAFGVLNGRFVIDTAPDVVTEIGYESMGGGPTTRTGVETAGHFDIYNGTVFTRGFFVIGRDNGTSVTAPDGLSSTMNLYGGSFTCPQLEISYISYYQSPNVSTCRPVLNIHGGEFNVTTRIRICYPQAHATINIDGGTLNTPNYINGYYNPGVHSEINVSNTGRFICGEFYPAYLSTTAQPTYMRVNVTDGGVFALKTVRAKDSTQTAQDTKFYFNGGTLLSRQNTYTDEIQSYMPIEVGEKGMTIDISNGTHWGLKMNSPIRAKDGVTDGGIKIVNTSGDLNRWICFNGGVDLAGGITMANKGYLLFGGDVETDVICTSGDVFISATKDVTVDSISMTGARNYMRVEMNGKTNGQNVRSYLLTAKSFTPPPGRIEVYAYEAGGTTYSEPFGTFPFLRVPASSALSAKQFVFRASNSASHTYRFIETVADGWKTISWVHEATDSRTKVDPRASNDWLTGSGKTFTIGPWLVNHTGSDTTENYMYSQYSDKTEYQAGGISVADSLTLAGGGHIQCSPFVKLGEGTLTFAGNSLYSFGTTYQGLMPGGNPAVWNLFDQDGNSVTGHQAGVIVDAGKLVLGTGTDSPMIRYPSANEFWVGSVTTTTPGGEKDAAMEVKSGVLQMSGNFVVGRNRGTPETASHEPLASSYVQTGGDVTVGKLIVGYRNGSTATQQDTFTLNGGHFAANGQSKIGEGSLTGVGTNVCKIVINDGVFETGKTTYGTTTDGRLIVNVTAATNQFSVFEMNGGEAKLWCDLVCWNAKPNFNTQVLLNGGTITFGGNNGATPKFNGGDYSELHWNGTVLKPYVPKYQSTMDSMFTYYTVREIGPNGAILDLSEANVDHVEPFNTADGKNPRNFTGTGDLIVRGGDTNRSLRLSCNLSITGDYIAEKGGVMEMWHQNYTKFANTKTVRVKDGGGVATYYSDPIKNVYLGETAADSTFLYCYGFNGYSTFVVGTTLSIKGTVYCAWRASGYGNPLRIPKGTNAMLRGPKGSFNDVDVPNQFKLHPLLQKEGLTVTFSLDTSNSGYDVVNMTASDNVYYGPVHPSQPPSGKTNVYDSSVPVSGTLTLYSETNGRMQEDPYTSGGGTVRVVEPLSGNGTIKLTSGRIEGRPEYFNGISLDLQNASVRFTESGTTTVNIKNLGGSATGLGVEGAEGKTVYATGVLTNNSTLVKNDPGTLVLQSDKDFTLLANGNKNAAGGWALGSMPTNGDIKSGNGVTVLAGTLALDMPHSSFVTNAWNNENLVAGGHPIPDGKGGAYPAVLEVWQGDIDSSFGGLYIGRRVDGQWDDCSKFTTRPYTAYNQYGGTVRVKWIIMGYGNYYFKDCARDELNLYGGLLDVGTARIAVAHMSTNVKIGDDEKEGVINVYGGELRKANGSEPFAVAGYYNDEVKYGGMAYPARGTVNVYGGAIKVEPPLTIRVPSSTNAIGKVNMYGGVIEAQNFVRGYSYKRAEGYIHFDGGTFRPLQNDGQLAGFSAVTVGAGGGLIDMTNANAYTVAQIATDPALNGEPDGGFGASGTGTLVLRVANGFTGPTRVKDTATVLQGVANAFSDTAVLDGGTLNLNGIATTFRTITGHGTIVGDCTVTEGLEPDGDLTFSGNLTVGNGVTVKMDVDDTGAATSQLNVTGALTGGTGVVFDFGRYDDYAFIEGFEAQLGTVGAGSSFGARAERLVTGNSMVGSVSLMNGAIVLRAHKRGTTLHFR